MPSPDRRAVFSRYNRLRAIARANPERIDPRRANAALGLAQRHAGRPYKATLTECTCPDWLYRGSRRRGHRGPCKHMLAAWVVGRSQNGR